MNGTFFERGQDIIPLFNQADANSDITGDWVRIRDYQRVLILLAKYGSEDVDDLGLQLLQATSAAGAGSKALSVPANGRYWTKTGTLTSATLWTAGTLTADADGLAFGASVPTGFTRVIDDVDTNPLLLAVELEVGHLDINNGFGWLTAFVEGDNVNNSCLLSAWAILMDCKSRGGVPPSAIS